jgi:hypothetical protein
MHPKPAILVSYSAVVEASMEQVSALMLQCPPLGPVKLSDMPFIISSSSDAEGTVFVHGGPNNFAVYTGKEPSLTTLVYLEVDRSRHVTALYGGWWYRAEYRIIPHKQGCILIHDVCNIAHGFSRLFVPLLKEYRALRNEKSTQAVKSAFEQCLQNMAQRLECHVQPIKKGLP